MVRMLNPEGGHIHINLARLKKGGEKFEVDIDPVLALNLKQGKPVDIHDVLKAEHIFSDAKKGLIASQHLMEKLFDTSDVLEVAKIIIKKGEIQLTSEHREEEQEVKKRRIIELLHRNAVDPSTHMPHPVMRLENALVEAKIKIDGNKTAEAQLDEIIKKLRPILPLKVEIKQIQIHLGSSFAAKCYPLAKSFGKEIKSEWLSDGSLTLIIEIPGGLEADLYSKLNHLTHGSIEIKLLQIR